MMKKFSVALLLCLVCMATQAMAQAEENGGGDEKSTGFWPYLPPYFHRHLPWPKPVPGTLPKPVMCWRNIHSPIMALCHSKLRGVGEGPFHDRILDACCHVMADYRSYCTFKEAGALGDLLFPRMLRDQCAERVSSGHGPASAPASSPSEA